MMHYRDCVQLACWAVLGLGLGTAQANPALEGYRNYEQITAEVAALAESSVVTASSLGTTPGGREIHLLTIGQGGDSKPAVLIVGGVHGPHLAAGELALRLARILAQPERQEVAQLLERVTFYVVPLPSPDASEKCFLQPWAERAGNARTTDDDRDFSSGEDPPEDLNGDGWITAMRVLDDTGRYRTHPDDPRVLIEADAKQGEAGQYRLYTEGLDNDQDQQFNEDGADGVALNRNFTFRYPDFGQAAGTHPMSEPETRALADFAFDHPQIAAVLCFTPEDNLLHPWKPDAADDKTRIKQHLAQADEPYQNALAERYRQIHGGSDPPPAARGAGSFSEWAYFHYGRWSLAARSWWIPKVPLPEGQQLKDNRGAEELNALRWFDLRNVDGFVDWSPIDHPDFPGQQVEVGGFKPYYRLNPPAAELDNLADKHFAFVQQLAASLPRVEIGPSRVAALGEGVFRVTAQVVNRGFLPTLPEMGETSQRAYPLQWELTVDQPVQWIQGHPRGRVSRLTGSGGTAELTWLLRLTAAGPARGRLKVSAPAVGASQVELPLP